MDKRKQILSMTTRASVTKEIPEWPIDDGEGGTRPTPILVKSFPGSIRSKIRRILIEGGIDPGDVTTENAADLIEASPEAMMMGQKFAELAPEVTVLCAFDPETDERLFKKEDEQVLSEEHGPICEQIMGWAIDISQLGGPEESEKGKDSSPTPRN